MPPDISVACAVTSWQFVRLFSSHFIRLFPPLGMVSLIESAPRFCAISCHFVPDIPRYVLPVVEALEALIAPLMFRLIVFVRSIPSNSILHGEDVFEFSNLKDALVTKLMFCKVEALMFTSTPEPFIIFMVVSFSIESFEDVKSNLNWTELDSEAPFVVKLRHALKPQLFAWSQLYSL